MKIYLTINGLDASYHELYDDVVVLDSKLIEFERGLIQDALDSGNVLDYIQNTKAKNNQTIFDLLADRLTTVDKIESDYLNVPKDPNQAFSVKTFSANTGSDQFMELKNGFPYTEVSLTLYDINGDVLPDDGIDGKIEFDGRTTVSDYYTAMQDGTIYTEAPNRVFMTTVAINSIRVADTDLIDTDTFKVKVRQYK